MRERPDPYCGFKNDKQRRLALLVREVRLGVTALVALTMTDPGRELVSRIGSLLSGWW